MAVAGKTHRQDMARHRARARRRHEPGTHDRRQSSSAHLGVLRIFAAENRGSGSRTMGHHPAAGAAGSPALSRSPMARAVRPASAPMPPSSALSRKPRSSPPRISPVSALPKARSTRSCRLIGTPASAISWRCAATCRAWKGLTGRMPMAITPRPELIEGIRRIAPFEVSVSFYPERHPDSPSHGHDIDLLKKKMDAGATRALGQFCFDNDATARFRDDAARGRHHHSRHSRHHADHQFQGRGAHGGQDPCLHSRLAGARL